MSETIEAAAELTRVRRRDREVTDEEWMRGLLHSSAVGTLATVHDGRPFVNTNIFVYDDAEHALFFHTARSGRTRSNIEADERVCFTVTRMGRLLPAPRAMNFSLEYEGVVAFGRGRVLDDREEAAAALARLMAKYAPHLAAEHDYALPSPEELDVTSVYRVDIEAWSGKKKEVAADFPGAYRWEDVSGGADAARGPSSGGASAAAR